MPFKKIITANYKDDSLSIVNQPYPFRIEKINLGDIFVLEDEGAIKIGPIDLTMDRGGRLLVINAHDDSLCKIDIQAKELISYLKLGRYPTNIKSFNNKIYIINSDSNTLSVVDDGLMEVIETIPIGNNPNSIEIDELYNRIYITNLESHTISVIYGNGMKEEIGLLEGPLRLKVSEDCIYLLSIVNRGEPNHSRLWAISRKELRRLWSIELKGIYYDFIYMEEKNKFYLINPEDGYLYSLLISNKVVERLIYLGGLPQKIIFDGKNNLYINDILNDEILVVDIEREAIVERIGVGKEPQGVLIL